MSNYLAIATVTAALQQALQEAVGNAVPNAKVSFSRPEGAGSEKQPPGVSIYLYQVTPNTALRNADLPARRGDGAVAARPQVALDLDYLFTFHGDDGQLEPQRLLGAVASALHAKPSLSREDIDKAEKFFDFLKNSGLEEQTERVRVTPTALSLEEFSKLWSVFFQVEYALSAAYRASVVLIESADTAREAPPVSARNLYAAPFRWPRVERVTSQAGAGAPILSGDSVLIQGRQLRADLTLVLVENQELTPSSVRDDEIALALPKTIHAGVRSLQIVQKVSMGTPPTPHRGFESNAAAFVLRPRITGASAAASPSGGVDITLTLEPDVGAGQRVLVVLNRAAAPSAASFVSEPMVSSADASQVTVKLRGVPAGAYLVRAQVDGAESLLTADAGGQFSGPTVTIP